MASLLGQVDPLPAPSTSLIWLGHVIQPPPRPLLKQQRRPRVVPGGPEADELG